MPELPGPRAKRFSEQFGLSFADASQLTAERSLADYYEAAIEASGGNARGTANWIRSELLRELENAGLAADKSPVPAAELGALVRIIDEGKISGKQGKEVLTEMFASGKSAAAVVAERGMVRSAIPAKSIALSMKSLRPVRTNWNSIAQARDLVRILRGPGDESFERESQSESGERAAQREVEVIEYVELKGNRVSLRVGRLFIEPTGVETAPLG
jgi:hypothetical protein